MTWMAAGSQTPIENVRKRPNVSPSMNNKEVAGPEILPKTGGQHADRYYNDHDDYTNTPEAAAAAASAHYVDGPYPDYDGPDY